MPHSLCYKPWVVTTWKCRKCKYVYDPKLGDPDGGIPPGTPFDQIPDTWCCPICGATKRDFFVLSTAPPAPANDRIAAPAVLAQPQSVRQPQSAGFTVGSLKGKPQR
ncbi:MAG: rubredoxin [Polyangia bacterium]